MAQLNFDATQVAPDAGQLDAIPAGWYNVSMDQSEMKPTKDGSGAYLECRFNILDGQYVGCKLFARLNLRNTNPVAQEIAYKQLSAIAHAVNILNVQDSSQLHGHPLKVKVKLRPASGEYEASNEISAYKNINEQVGGPAAAPAQSGAPAGFGGAPAQQAPAQAGAAQPWQQPQQAPAQQPQQAPQQAAQPWQQPQQEYAQPQAAQQPQQAPAPQQPAEQQWQQPQAQQPWQQAPAQGAPQQAPAQQQPQQAPSQAPMTGQPAAMEAPAGFNPQSATPPWAQPQQ